jgi:DNA (cytosine-5)-methyltransferase 1
LSAGKGQHFANIKKYFKQIGYVVEPFIVNAYEFGVLQHRRRVIILGWNKDLNLSIGKLVGRSTCDHTVKSIFSGLPKLHAGEGIDKYLKYTAGRTDDYLHVAKIRNGIDILTQHIARPHTEQDKEIYRIAVEKWRTNKERLNYNDLPARLKTHNNRESFLDRFKVVADDMPYSHTVVAHIAKDGHYYIHPDIEQNRSISVREAARLQTFPDDYYFEGPKEGQIRTAAYRQIGNAVPPLMVEKIARKLAGYIR